MASLPRPRNVAELYGMISSYHFLVQHRSGENLVTLVAKKVDGSNVDFFGAIANSNFEQTDTPVDFKYCAQKSPTEAGALENLLEELQLLVYRRLEQAAFINSDDENEEPMVSSGEE